MPKNIQHVPTHLFLGFLGTGKTSAILNCFKQKPDDEHWAVLVNEFGKQGIDGKIYQDKGIKVKEVPGGCLCCAAGVPFQVAILDILKTQRPDRLFIESSGASHAQGVIKTLQQDTFNNVLDLKANVCLIDPMHLLDKKYYQNNNFKAQLEVADILIANKIDQATPEALLKLNQLIQQFNPAKSLTKQTSFGNIKLDWLNATALNNNHSQATQIENDNFITIGWNVENSKFFNRNKLSQWLSNDTFIRAKGMVQLNDGWHSVNVVNQHIDFTPIQPQSQSRIEIILTSISQNIEAELKKSLLVCLA